MALARHLLQFPVFLIFVELIGTYTGYDMASIAVLPPIDHKGIEMIAGIVQHREQGIGNTFAQPLLGFLIHRVVGIPSIAAVARGIVILAQRSCAHADPRFKVLHLII